MDSPIETEQPVYAKIDAALEYKQFTYKIISTYFKLRIPEIYAGVMTYPVVVSRSRALEAYKTLLSLCFTYDPCVTPIKSEY